MKKAAGKDGPRARILDVTPEQYLADPCDRPSLSSGVATTMVAESPAHAYAKHPRLGGRGGDSGGTKAMTAGGLIHKLMLGTGKDVELIDAKDFRTKAAQEARDAARAAGKMPILQHDFAEKAATAAKLVDRCREYGYEFTARSELAIEWTDRAQDGEVLCRSMLDHVFLDRGIIYDIKSTEAANPSKIERRFLDYGYDVQYAAYTRALAALRPELAGRIRMIFLFVELEEPYSVVPIEPDGSFREIGALRWNRALTLWEQCLAQKHWPSYYSGGEPLLLHAPNYVVEREIGTLTE
ncbi:MAG: PD-(D/E)XK nuclease-like domain-containing protein [Proteobacteria bacterium]|nr:PD-(D/E)XK nuclease-like domain-containing protein [Pseudomonadota bacterium]